MAAAAYGSRAASGSPSLSFSLLLSFVALLQDSLSLFCAALLVSIYRLQ